MWTVAKLKDGTPNKHNYGFAWGIDSVNGHRVIEHSGSWQGFETHIARYVNDGVTVVVLMNLGSVNPTRIAHGVAGLYRRGLSTAADTLRF
jgi:O-glycosyl hydrolase